MKSSLRLAALAAAALLGAACAARRPKPTPAPAPVAPAPVPVAAAAPAPAPAPAPVVAPKGPHHKFWGGVESIDAASGSFVVKSRRGRARTFRVASAAKFTKGGGKKAIAFSDLTKGARVRVIYAGDVAVRVHVFVVEPK